MPRAVNRETPRHTQAPLLIQILRTPNLDMLRREMDRANAQGFLPANPPLRTSLQSVDDAHIYAATQHQ